MKELLDFVVDISCLKRDIKNVKGVVINYGKGNKRIKRRNINVKKYNKINDK